MTKKYHWVIRSKKKNAIWKKPYISLEEAKQEYKTQFDRLPAEQAQKSDWKIEMRENQYFKLEKELSTADKKAQEEFENF